MEQATTSIHKFVGDDLWWWCDLTLASVKEVEKVPCLTPKGPWGHTA